MRDDRRSTQRLRTQLLGRWKRGRKVINARIGDINAGGLLLETEEAIAPGQVMDLIVDLPSGPISFLAVSRARQERGIGVSIFSMAPQDRARWDRHYSVALVGSR